MYGYTPYTDPHTGEPVDISDVNHSPAIPGTGDLRVVFLDIDGVLQPHWAEERWNHSFDETIDNLVEEHSNDIYRHMDRYDVAAARWDWDEGAVENIRCLCEQAGAVIMVESDWREYNDENQMRALLAIWGLDEYYVGNTVSGPYGARVSKDESIRDYVEQHVDELASYVIIDDNPVFADMDRQVLTRQLFNGDDLVQAVEMLS